MSGIKETKTTLHSASGNYQVFYIEKIRGVPEKFWQRLPFSIRILLEGIIRNAEDTDQTEKTIQYLAGWKAEEEQRQSIPFYPGRVVLQDFTGVPVMNDLAAMRDAMQSLDGDPTEINPTVPVDLVIDHSVQVDVFGSRDALEKNAQIEFERNRERYEFLRWSENAFKNFRVVPPATGIIHQVNLEYLAKVVMTQEDDGEVVAYPDTLVGTDSHTTMINGLGIVGWGVGGIEAVAAMMGQPIEILAPDVIGVELKGKLPEGTMPTDLTLTVIEMLRKKGVVGKFVEFFGEGLSHLSLADRAMIANMTPESGATMIYFPVDEQSLAYLELTGKDKEHVQLVEDYFRFQHLFHNAGDPPAEYTEVLSVDMNSIEPSLAGPKRPQDRISLSDMQASFQQSMTKPRTERGFGVPVEDHVKKADLQINGKTYRVGHGFLAIAAITSCTNTSNPTVMIASGLLAQKAAAHGLKVPEYVKTSFAPGSRVVTEYLKRSGLMDDLEALRFNIVGYGCTTCIGNSGPLPDEVVRTIEENDLVASAILSGNRNFEGRVNPHTVANYLASPPLVVAYALAGTVDIDLVNDPLGFDHDNKPVFLADIWPSSEEIQAVVKSVVQPNLFDKNYQDVYFGNQTWNAIQSDSDILYEWDHRSTYLQKPPFFSNLFENGDQKEEHILGARVLVMLGDSVTTDHISPAGAIPADSPAGRYLINHDIPVEGFNSFGSRRGNDKVMARGTFGNIRIKNKLVPDTEGGITKYFPNGEIMSIFEASEKYQEDGTPLIVIAGKEYGTGSSRDWAAKGPMLLGVKAVIAESYERIHRSNLVGMGILPLQFLPGESANKLGLKGDEYFDIHHIENISPGEIVEVTATSPNGEIVKFETLARIDTPRETTYYEHGGIMNAILLDLK